MIDHVSIAVSNISISSAFYDAVLAPLGMTAMAVHDDRIGYGKRYPEFWINQRLGIKAAPGDTGHHVCLRAPSEAAVTAFHDAAIAHGGASDGAPGPRPATMTNYFGAFIRDPDNNKIEALTFPR